jgi:hypothetical protein
MRSKQPCSEQALITDEDQTPKTGEGQVHPTARSKRPCKRYVNANRIQVHAESNALCHFEKNTPNSPALLLLPQVSLRLSGAQLWRDRASRAIDSKKTAPKDKVLEKLIQSVPNPPLL